MFRNEYYGQLMDNFAANVKKGRSKNKYWIVDGIEEKKSKFST